MRIAGLITPPDSVNVEGSQSARGPQFQRPNRRRAWLPLLRPTQRSKPAGFLPVHRVPQVRVQLGECAGQRWRLRQASDSKSPVRGPWR